MNKVNLAIVSPAQNAYSETFIQAHKEQLDANVFYYFGSKLPYFLEGQKSIVPTWVKAQNKLIGWFKKKPLYEAQQNLLLSFRQKKIKVVLAEYGPVGMAILPICQRLQIPLLVHFHGYDASVFKTIEENQNYIPIFSYASSIIVVSQLMKKALIDLGCPEKKITVSPCAPNNSFFQIEASLVKKNLIGVGRFVDKKAPYLSILAFKKVLIRHPDAKLTLYGDGPLWNTCFNLIQQLNLENNIHLPGVISPKDYQTQLSTCRAFVQHSITACNGDMEGTPVSVMEAAAAAVPVISTLHAGIPDVIIHQETGLLCPEHDVKTMAAHMDNLLSDRELAISMGHKSRQRILQNFTMDKHISVIDQLIQQSLASK